MAVGIPVWLVGESGTSIVREVMLTVLNRLVLSAGQNPDVSVCIDLNDASSERLCLSLSLHLQYWV